MFCCSDSSRTYFNTKYVMDKSRHHHTMICLGKLQCDNIFVLKLAYKKYSLSHTVTANLSLLADDK